MPGRMIPVAALLAVVGCGGLPTDPIGESFFTLAPGPHTLSIQAIPTTTTNSSGLVFTSLLCVGTGPSSFAVPVDVLKNGDIWEARAFGGTLALTLTEGLERYEGTLGGAAAARGMSVTVRRSDTDPAPVAVSSNRFAMVMLAGSLDGAVSFASPQGQRGCSSNSWGLSPRR